MDKFTKLAAETHDRLLTAAGAIFSEVGFQAATTREICVLASANAAAVNYHFGDKLGLYTEVLKALIGGEEERAAEHSLLKLRPREGLRGFVALMSQNVDADDVPDRYTRIMLHELSQPTAGLSLVVATIIRPRARLLCQILAKLMHRSPEDLRVRLCAHSIIGQIVHYRHSAAIIKLLYPDGRITAQMKTQLVEHVTEFSLAAVKSIARTERKPARKKARRASRVG